MTNRTHDTYITNELPLLMDYSDFTKLADDGTTMTFRADNPAVIGLAIGMTTKRRFVTRDVAAGTILLIERLPHEFDGFPGACKVSLPVDVPIVAQLKESSNYHS